jgi:hypothetical protein
MVYLKSFLFGIGGAVLGVVLWITVAFILPLFGPYVIARLRGTGSGGSAGYVGSGSILIAALIGFAIAFAWEWHRLYHLSLEP